MSWGKGGTLFMHPRGGCTVYRRNWQWGLSHELITLPYRVMTHGLWAANHEQPRRDPVVALGM